MGRQKSFRVYNREMKHSQGFTLIELLVVIAIIGLLASIVLVSLSSARQKGLDTRVISDIRQLRIQMEADYTPTAGYSASFASTNTLVGTGAYATLTGDIGTNGGTFNVTGASPYSSFALYSKLPSNTSIYYCMDSKGNTNPAAATNIGTTCP